MRPQETKFVFVYNEIKQRILESQILPGNSSLSSGVYCEQFYVSRYTTNHTSEVLREERLTEVQPRLAPTITSGKDMPDSLNTIFEILKQKQIILQVYQTFTLVPPSLFVFALQGCDMKIMPHYEQAMKVLRLGCLTGRRRTPSNLGYDILGIRENPLLGELYSAFGLYDKFSFFIEECPYFRKHFLQKPAPTNSVVIDTLKGKDPSAKHRQLLNMYQALINSTESILKNLRGTTPEYPMQTGVPLARNSMRSQDYYYSEIVSDPNLKIGLGEYSISMYLPYEKQLAGQCNVPLSTVRKALSELEQRGFAKTLNDRGTIVIEPDDIKAHQLALNPGYVERALRYLHALQLIALLIHPTILEATLRLTRDGLDELTDRFTSPGPVYLADMLEAILKHTTLEPLYVILSETNHLPEQGHHFAYYPSKRRTPSHLNKQVITASRRLNQSSVDSFADGIADCYCYILVCMKKYMTEKYKFSGASNIRILEEYQHFIFTCEKQLIHYEPTSLFIKKAGRHIRAGTEQ